jgi:DNA-binding CsgD family transcriptional regulator
MKAAAESSDSPGPTGSGFAERLSAWLHQRWPVWLFLITVFFVYDLVLDILAGEVDAHLLVEAIVFIICAVVLVAEWRRNSRLGMHLASARASNQKLSGQFTEYVHGALASWRLSNSEQEIAWLILKGFSFAEIASIRGVQEKTARQQATAIYAKSGCRNRSEFVAHFIQDLLASDFTSRGVTNASDQNPG